MTLVFVSCTRYGVAIQKTSQDMTTITNVTSRARFKGIKHSKKERNFTDEINAPTALDIDL